MAAESAEYLFRLDFSRLPQARLARMRLAASEIVSILEDTASRQSHIVTEMIGGAPFIIGEHYPPDDVYDAGSGAGFYYHAHHDDPRAYTDGLRHLPEHGHFHLLMNRLAVPKGVRSARAGHKTQWLYIASSSLFKIEFPNRILGVIREWLTGVHEPAQIVHKK